MVDVAERFIVMKRSNSFWTVLGFAIIINCCTSAMYAQDMLPPADSAALSVAGNDTMQLRQLASSRLGTRAGAAAQNRLGMIAFNNNKYTNAEREFRATLQQSLNLPETGTASYYLGRIQYRKNRFTDAMAYFRTFLAGNPSGDDYDWGRYSLVRAMYYTNDSGFHTAARSYLASSHSASQSKDVQIQYDIVRYLGSRAQYDQAIAEANNLIVQFPGSPYVSFVEPRVVDYYMLKKDSLGAIGKCNELLIKYPANTYDAARAQYMLASCYMYWSNFSQARTEYSKLKRIHPAVTRWVNASDYGMALADYEEGKAKNDSSLIRQSFDGLKSFVHNHPFDRNIPKALLYIADLNIAAGNYEEALSEYGGIIGFDTTMIDTGKYAGFTDDMKVHRELVLQAHLARGRVLQMYLHRSTDALAEYEIVLAMRSDNTDALLNKALCLVGLGRKEEARPILQRLIDHQTAAKSIAAQVLATL